MAESESGWSPPNARELLEASIPNGYQWYELRLPLKTLSYTVYRYDDALQDARALKIFKPALFYCFKENGVLRSSRACLRTLPSTIQETSPSRKSSGHLFLPR